MKSNTLKSNTGEIRQPQLFADRNDANQPTSDGGAPSSSYRKLAVALLAATVVVGLTVRAILAQSNPPGAAASTQDEPIKLLLNANLDVSKVLAE